MTAQWDRNPQGQDRADGLGAKHDGPVAESDAPTPNRETSNTPLPTSEELAFLLRGDAAEVNSMLSPNIAARITQAADLLAREAELEALLAEAQTLFALGVGAKTESGDRANQERCVREGGELMLRISKTLISSSSIGGTNAR